MRLNPLGRAELKYWVPRELAPELRACILRHACVDSFAEGLPGNTYTVRSIYFDTRRLDFFYEKMDGESYRKKLRVRAYNQYSPDSPAFLEIKRRHLNRVIKERVAVPLSQVGLIHRELVLPGQIEDAGVPVRNALKKYIANLSSLDLRPTALIVYDREAYTGLIDPGERVTIDKNVRSFLYPELDDLFRDSGLLPVTDCCYILELKFDRYMPKWMVRLVKEFQLRCESIPKYCQGVDKCMSCAGLQAVSA